MSAWASSSRFGPSSSRSPWAVRSSGAKVTVLGLTFMEERADPRGSRVMDLIQEVASDGAEVIVHDPEACADEAVEVSCVPQCASKALPRADSVMPDVEHRACQVPARDEIPSPRGMHH